MSILDQLPDDEAKDDWQQCAVCGHTREDHRLEQVKRGVLERMECTIEICDCLRFSTGEPTGIVITEI